MAWLDERLPREENDMRGPRVFTNGIVSSLSGGRDEGGWKDLWKKLYCE